MSDIKDPFEEFIKSKVENFEMETSNEDWTQFSKNLTGKKTPFFTKPKFYLSALAVVASAGLAFNISTTPSTNNETNKLPIAEANVAEVVNSNTQTKIVNEEPKENEPVIELNKVVEEKKQEPTQNEPVKPQEPKKKKIEKEADKEKADKKPIQNNVAPTIVSSKLAVCSNEQLSFKVGDSLAGYKVSWDFGDGNETQKFRPNYYYTMPGQYTVTAKLLKDEEVKEVSLNITVNERPTANFNWETSDFNCHNSAVCFKADAKNADNYVWSFGDRTISDEMNPKHQYTRKGWYTVKMVAKNHVGCKDSLIKRVKVLKAYNLMASNHISPNGDGKDDTWMPLALAQQELDFNLKVIDQNGKMVFSTTDAYDSWDGSNAQLGQMYFWIASVNDEGKVSEFGGSILVTE